MLFFRLLGSCSLHRDGVEAAVPMQKRRLDLLAMLALARPAGVSRERAQAYLWPESTRERSRHALEQLIYATRRTLGENVVLSESGRLTLDRQVVDSDLWRFSDAVAEERWADATANYTGDLLEGFHVDGASDFEQWVESERQRYRREYQRALESLAAAARRAGDHAGALALWLKLADTDPLSSRIAVEVIKAHADAGNAAGGVSHARQFQDRIRTELEVQPSKEIEELALSLTASASVQAGRRAANDDRGDAPRLAPSNASETRTGVIAAADRPVRHALTGMRRHAAFALGLSVIVMATVSIDSAPAGDTRSSSPPITRPLPADRAAREAYLRGMIAWSERSKAGLDTAVIEFRRAVEADPGYADAYAGLASAYVLLGYSGYRPADAMFAKSKAAARRALDLDSTNAQAYAALGFELAGERRFQESEAAFRRSLALDPRLATAHQWYGILLNMLGRLPEAVQETQIAARLDPLSLQIQNTYATFLHAAGRSAEALREYERFVGEEPDSAWISRNPWLLSNMARVYAANGQFDRAVRTIDVARRILPRHPRPLWDLASIYIEKGRVADAERVFALADTSNEHYLTYRAFVYAQEGRLDSAFAWLDRVHEWGMPMMISLRSSADLANLRSDPRFAALLDRIGLPR